MSKIINYFKKIQIENANKEANIEANNLYSIITYKDDLYFAFNNVPVIKIDSSTTSSEIVEMLKNLKALYREYRQND